MFCVVPNKPTGSNRVAGFHPARLKRNDGYGRMARPYLIHCLGMNLGLVCRVEIFVIFVILNIINNIQIIYLNIK